MLSSSEHEAALKSLTLTAMKNIHETYVIPYAEQLKTVHATSTEATMPKG